MASSERSRRSKARVVRERSVGHRFEIQPNLSPIPPSCFHQHGVYLRAMDPSQKTSSAPNQTGENSRFVDVRFPAQWSADEEKIQRVLAKAVGCNEQELGEFRVVRKNLDARKRPVQVGLAI